MNCKQCGAEIPDGSVFCEACGTVQTPEPDTGLQLKLQQKPNLLRADTGEQIVFYVKKRFAGMLCAAVLGGAAAITGICLLVSLLNRPDLTDYVTVTAEGYDGRGTVECAVDSTALSERLFGAPPSDLSQKDAEALSDVVKFMRSSLKTEDSTDHLSNGDKLTFTIENLDMLSESTGLKFKKNNTFEYEVASLRVAQRLALADLIDVKFVGYNGSGCAELSVKEDSGAPFSMGGYDRYLSIDGTSRAYSLSMANDISEYGTLSNGDTLSVHLEDYGSTETYLLENYGVYIDTEEPAEFTVSGLAEPETLDVFSLVDIAASGLDGTANIVYHWKSTDMTQGDLHIYADSEDSNHFRVNSTMPVPRGSIYFVDSYNNNDDETYIDDFYLQADRSNGLSAGDSVNISLSSRGYDTVQSTDAYSQSGLLLSEISHTMSVDSSMVGRYITSDQQMRMDLIRALGNSQSDRLNETLTENWSRIVHGSSNFACYDQKVTEGPDPTDAYFAKTNEDANTYTIWMIYRCVCQDSETPDGKPIFMVLTFRDPIVSGGSSPAISTLRDPDISTYDSLTDIQEQWWFTNTENLRHYPFV